MAVERGIVAYILVKVNAGKEKEVLDDILRSFTRNITEARITYGEYDIVIRVVANNMRMLDMIVKGIRRTPGVAETTTLIAA